MEWSLLPSFLLSGFAIASGIDIAFIHRDPPLGARTATRTSRRVIGIIAILVGLINLVINIY